MRTNFDKAYEHVLKVARKKVAFIEHTLFVTSWQDDTFKMEIRITTHGRIHKFIYKECSKDIRLIHKNYDKAKYIASKVDDYIIQSGDFTEDLLELID